MPYQWNEELGIHCLSHVPFLKYQTPSNCEYVDVRKDDNNKMAFQIILHMAVKT